VLLGYSIYRHGTPGAAQLYDVAIAIGYRALKEICEPIGSRFAFSFRMFDRRIRALSAPFWPECSIRCRGVRHRVRSVVARPRHRRRGPQPP